VPDARRPPPTGGLSPIPGEDRAAREIVAALRGDIAAGRLTRGARLPGERDLARHFGVSQPTVREAVRALDLMGLVDVRHGSGVYVTADVGGFLDTSLRTLLQVERVGIVDVLDLRTLLGGYSARRAATHATTAEIARMTALLDLADAPPAGATAREIATAPGAFQIAVSAAAHNPLLLAVESVLVKITIQLQLAAFAARGRDFWTERVGAFRSDRRRLLDFVAAHDAEGAASAMHLYLRTQFAQFSADPALAAASLADPLGVAGDLDIDLPPLGNPA
jgi:GntR family transcriptional regulator, transcriptional repressor for pyruvate dehydrogenase complex